MSKNDGAARRCPPCVLFLGYDIGQLGNFLDMITVTISESYIHSDDTKSISESNLTYCVRWHPVGIDVDVMPRVVQTNYRNRLVLICVKTINRLEQGWKYLVENSYCGTSLFHQRQYQICIQIHTRLGNALRKVQNSFKPMDFHTHMCMCINMFY